ncbi:MAG: hypothetical protein AVDCRST_MAG07-439 [uncultured Frankineae bacterium]|uniref:Uncharacterized protein n=1 Tax=uncultured Frankineae bacterium TaxID=437475 RepID=A0A6J4KKM6_9ACTN|nr:MAG: hypothetical protein AVDCRST_MAG07-439 [uncultured Frankineae bacterium]
MGPPRGAPAAATARQAGLAPAGTEAHRAHPARVAGDQHQHRRPSSLPSAERDVDRRESQVGLRELACCTRRP